MSVDLTRFAAVAQTSRNTATTTEKYRHISTMEVVDIVRQQGWEPTGVQVARAAAKNRGFQKHLIRFRNPSLSQNANGAYPEVLLSNSHNGTSAFKFHVGVFELVCSNGLIIQTERFGSVSVLHRGFAAEKVVDAIGEVVSNVDTILSRREVMRGIQLTDGEVYAFAQSAAVLRYGEEGNPSVRQLTYARHSEQRENTLWNVYNRVQEAIMRGGVYHTTANGNRRKAKAITSIGEDVRLNTSLYRLAEEMAKLKGVELPE